MNRAFWSRDRALAAAILALAWPGASPARASTSLEELKTLEREAAATIERAKQAFVFLEGGSGFLIAGGHVITNAHVVAERAEAGRTDFGVHLTGGRRLRADLGGRDPEGDVALLKVRGDPGVAPLEIGDADRLHVGQPVIALGDPFLIGAANIFFGLTPPDYEPSASLGVISALHRLSDTYTDAIQVDVAVNRGNSGGPLLTLDGKVVGINGKIETRFENGINSGVGYAIPMSQVKRFLEPLKAAKGGIVRHGVIFGLEMAEKARADGSLPVTRVRPDSLAERAGFLLEDGIVAIDGAPVPSRQRYRGIIGTYPAGHEVMVRLRRAEKEIELKVQLVEGGPLPFLGVTLETPAGTDGGAKVVALVPASPAERAGVEVGDVIVMFDKKRIIHHTELLLGLQARAPGETVDLEVVRAGKTLALAVQIGGQHGRRR